MDGSEWPEPAIHAPVVLVDINKDPAVEEIPQDVGWFNLIGE